MGISTYTENKIINGYEHFTGYNAVINSDHAYIHLGKAFTTAVNAGSISAVYYIGFVTPTVASGKYVHYRPLGITTSANYVGIKLYEGDTFTGGTASPTLNRNRLSSIVTAMQSMVKGVTVTPAGTVLIDTGIGGTGVPTAQSGGGGGEKEEWILKQNTSYVLALTPAGATTVTASLFWYEEDAGLDS